MHVIFWETNFDAILTPWKRYSSALLCSAPLPSRFLPHVPYVAAIKCSSHHLTINHVNNIQHLKNFQILKRFNKILWDILVISLGYLGDIPLVHWSICPSVHWSIGPLVHWTIGLLDHWSIGPLVNWAIGPLAHCTMCTLGSIFTSQPNKLRHTLKVVFWYIF